MKETINCSLEVAEILIGAGADVMQLNKDGESAVNIALKAVSRLYNTNREMLVSWARPVK